MEARLLLQCLTSPEKVKLAIDKLSKKPNDKNPSNWSLETLLNVCKEEFEKAQAIYNVIVSSLYVKVAT